ncbi:MAG: VOC family protein [Candidatus Magasanikbacteria bacterium]|nr:VOC family protein [Candidatus Magasanikbacteria bacterium]
MQIKELGHVVLYVTNLERSVHFYRDILGFTAIAVQPGVAAFSSGRTHYELLLIEIGGTPVAKQTPQPGLYHIGFKVGDTDEELRLVIRDLNKNNISIIGATDHGVTHSLYIEDPDGNELELYVDVSDIWKSDPGAIMMPPRALHL